MKDKTKIPSRRALLHIGVRSLAGAGVLGTLGQGASAASDNRALVCIYLFGGEGGSNLPNVTELKDLHRKQVLAVARNVAPPVQTHSAVSTPGQFMAQKYQALRFLPNGFATLEWAARKAGIDPVDGAGAFTFQSGVSMLCLDGATPEGDQFENATLRSAMSRVKPLRLSFPDTGLGRQLRDVTRLLQARHSLGLNRPVFVGASNGFTRSAERTGTLIARQRDLGQAMAAFYQATVELGLERQVTTYTDAEFPLERGARSNSRLILGGAAMEGDASRFSALSADAFAGSLASWHGPVALA